MKSKVPHAKIPRAMDLLQSGCILSSRSPSAGASLLSSSGWQSKDGCYWVGWGKSRRQASATENDLSVYAPDFFLTDPKPWHVFDHSAKLTHTELTTLLLEVDGGVHPGIQWKPTEYQEFRAAFQDLKGHFEAGTLRKAVPIVLEEGQFQNGLNFTPRSRAALLLHLLRSTQNFPLHLYGVWDDEEGILGATPEILFKQAEPDLLSTVAVAGTRSKSGREGDSPSLLHDPKEMEEHRIVIEGILASLSGLGEVEVGKTQELELPTLIHLMTPITLVFTSNPADGESSGGHPFETSVRRLHPTPALGAFPKEEGRVWLANYPLNQKRKRFGAPFGATWRHGEGDGESLCLVAIRNIQWQGTSFMIGAGCGVVPASQVDRECDELRVKLQSVKESFGFL